MVLSPCPLWYVSLLWHVCVADYGVGYVLTPGFFYLVVTVRIDPGNAFRIHVSVDKYTLVNNYGVLDLDAQEHDLWFDSSDVYTLNCFIDDMASKII
jgi:hypothetical protein